MISAAPFAASLARYAATGEEAAFAEVVRLAGPLVWRVAMRRLNDAQLAEEAAQNVFITLARKAQAVSARPGALAWLHRAATLEAANLARSHARREHRHRLMADQFTEFPAVPAEPAPAPLDARLDEALNRLPETDRALLLGRFYEGLSFRELGARAGKTEEAAKKQAQRALERLRQHLGRRRVTLSVTALAGLLGTELSSAALPPALAASLSTSAVAAASTVTAGAAGSLATHILAAMSTTKALASAAALLLLLLATDHWQQQRLAALKEHAAQATQRLEARRAAGSHAVSREASREIVFRTQPVDMTPPDPLTGEALVRAYMREGWHGLYDPGWQWDFSNMDDILQQVPKQDWERLLSEIDATSASPSVKIELAGQLLSRWAERQPAWATAELMRWGGPHLSIAMQKWVRRDSAAAWAWLESQVQENKLAPLGARSYLDREKALCKAVVESIDRTGSGALNTFLKAQTDSPLFQTLTEAACEMLLARPDKSEAIALLKEAEAASPGLARRVLVEMVPRSLTVADSVPEKIEAIAAILRHPDFPAGQQQAFLLESLMRTEYHQAPAFMAVLSAPEQRAENLARLALRLDAADPVEARSYVTFDDPGVQRLLNEASAATALALAERGHAEIARCYVDKIIDEPAKAKARSAVETILAQFTCTPNTTQQ